MWECVPFPPDRPDVGYPHRPDMGSGPFPPDRADVVKPRSSRHSGLYAYLGHAPFNIWDLIWDRYVQNIESCTFYNLLRYRWLNQCKETGRHIAMHAIIMECVHVQVIISQILTEWRFSNDVSANDDSRICRTYTGEKETNYIKSRYSPETNCIIRSKVKPWKWKNQK